MGFKIKKTVNGETVWEPIKAKKYTASKTIEYTGTLPITINANGQPLLDYQISGNTEQTGTPTPENPIMPIGCGELETTGTRTGQYKLPILSNSTVTNIYLGEVETTRRIKKLVLTGQEPYQNYSYASTNGVQIINMFETAYRRASGLCNIYPISTVAGSTSCVWVGSGGGDRNLYFVSILSDMGMSTANEFKSYVQQQYAAGTPVTIWYVLAEPETGVVNEPLMKIGNYADTVDSTQTSVQIPTFAGTTVINYDGTTKPSQMYTEYNSQGRWEDIDNYKMANENWTQEVT